MENFFKIEMGSYREDNSIFYTETLDGITRKLVAAVDVHNRFILAPHTVLYLNSFMKWDETNQRLSIDSYIRVLERIYNFLRKKGFKVSFSSKENVWGDATEFRLGELTGGS